ncbi:hypothetical protein ILUMI_24992 [Ignelater luminosus]|uniref:Gustatory receptor n=1 Tax=Ignelater luminosus TaxID=2038154 RepID=A0A8K0CBD6_IGNLU|nr:hypothetical protein ILUMI_24992 [Ignelater luminosus]
MIYICIGLTLIILLLISSFLLTGMIYFRISCHYFFEIFFVHNAPLIVNTFVILQICTLILFIKQRLVWLNEELSDLALINENWPQTQNQVSQSKVLYIFEKIRLKHLKLYEISNNINKIYSLQILLIIFKNFITLISEFLYYGKNVINNKHIDTKNMILSQIQLITAISQIVALVFACSQVSIQVEKTASLIHNINSQDHCNEDLKMQVNFFSLQLLHENLQFTACKIFVVNENLLLTIAGAVATYLVIVIQFQFGNSKQPITNI